MSKEVVSSEKPAEGVELNQYGLPKTPAERMREQRKRSMMTSAITTKDDVAVHLGADKAWDERTTHYDDMIIVESFTGVRALDWYYQDMLGIHLAFFQHVVDARNLSLIPLRGDREKLFSGYLGVPKEPDEGQSFMDKWLGKKKEVQGRS